MQLLHRRQMGMTSFAANLQPRAWRPEQPVFLHRQCGDGGTVKEYDAARNRTELDSLCLSVCLSVCVLIMALEVAPKLLDKFRRNFW